MATSQKILWEEDEIPTKQNKRKSPRGEKTTQLVVSSHIGDNSSLFAKILNLHVPVGSKVADVTYGKGVFWRKVNQSNYIVFATDIKTGVDCRSLPYTDGEMDCVVLDPPYMEGFYRDDESYAGQGTHESFQDHYSNGTRPKAINAKWHDAVLEMYVQAAMGAIKSVTRR